MGSVEELIIAQRLNVTQMRRVVPNYRKLSKEKFSLKKTQTRINNLQELWSSCKDNELKIQQQATEALRKLTYFTTSEFIEAETYFEEALDQLTEIVESLEKGDSPSPGDKANRHSNSTMIGETHGPSSFALPRITIPKFNGETTRWERFRDSFKALVGENVSLTAGQKLYYLKSFLEGSAARMIEHVTVSDENYEGAWKSLTDEYDNVRALIIAHIHAFASLPVMKTENETELKRLRDTVNSSLTALKNLNRPVNHWDDLLVYLITQKLSPRTRTEWNLSLGASNDFPSFQFLRDFLTERIRGIATSIQVERTDFPSTSTAQNNKPKNRANTHNTTARQCPECSGNHSLGFCRAWQKKSIDDRFALAKSSRVCFNCLQPGHFPQQCPSPNRCRKCQTLHHTLLHRTFSNQQGSGGAAPVDQPADAVTPAKVNLVRPETSSSAPLGASDPSAKLSQIHAAVNTSHETSSVVLLATAWVNLRTSEDRVLKARALLDQGLTHSFISESLAQRLRTTRHRADLGITSFGDQYSGYSTSYMKLTLESCVDQSARLPMVAYVYQKISSYAANQVRRLGTWPHLKGLALADPAPSSKEPINALIGADLYGYLLVGPIRRGSIGSPTAQLTTLGWIISGPTNTFQDSRSPIQSAIHCGIALTIDDLIRQFWETEEIPSKSFLTPEEEECERHFVTTHTRDSSGRYVVRLPFHGDRRPALGNSQNIALLRYTRQEACLKKNPELALAYSNFLKEYESMGHMEKVQEPDVSNNPLYIPHHPVIRESSTTTKLRVVFNASSATSNGTSLNDHLHIGPKLQREIGCVLSNWRRHQFVYIADIEKMFRQILVHRDDIDYQRIVFRPEPDGPILNYRLLTLTYGTGSAPYLANRVLQQLANDEGDSSPEAVEVIKKSTYVDDVLFGADDRESARNLRLKVISLLNRGGFHLRKWATNDIDLLSDVNAVGHNLAIDLSTSDVAVLKVLGINWLPKEDAFSFQVAEIPTTRSTKRTILSFIARLFDPLGWASPVVISAKLLMQDLWLAKVDWDEEVPQNILEKWEDYCKNLPNLSILRIPRWMGTTQARCVMELHGFADASQRAFSAVVYLRVPHSPDQITVSLLVAKSKVASLKTTAIPRLELNGALLLVRLLEYVQQSFGYDSISVHGWTDSTVALAWVSQHPSRWKLYVANRVSEIQTRMPKMKWHHVSTYDNPADCASRGISASELVRHPLWWSGPAWLKQNSAFWPNTRPFAARDACADPQTLLHEQRPTASINTVQKTAEWEFPFRFSSWGKLLRVTAIMFHWLPKSCERHNEKATHSGDQLVERIQHAREFWVRRVQSLNFNIEIQAIKSQTPLPRSSPLKRLNPFLDGKGQLRLDGRLRHSFLTYDERFPLVLPRHHISELIIDQTHLRSLHGGTQLTLRLLRQHYWILGARSLVKARINRCLTCVRERATTASQLMGDLPAPRVNQSPPFSHCGVDYAGPFQVIPYVGRGQRARKYYVALFVCLATRAIHLEYVDDYTTSGFLAAFQRFISRRGLPTDVYSDNGTNFQGADNELRRTFIAMLKRPELREETAKNAIRWHFIPASAPHFGGLWEAGVRSFKHHFKRVVGSRTLSQLELSTLLCQIEACLNSRLLSPLSDDPDNFEALTPGHFLIGRPLLSLPEPSLLDTSLNENRMSRWQKVQAMREHIWKAWTRDYLHTLQQRAKWHTESRAIKIGSPVLLKNELLPPSRWELARVIRTHPGPDSLVRVVTLRTAKTTLKRPISKVCPLPCDSF